MYNKNIQSLIEINIDGYLLSTVWFPCCSAMLLSTHFLLASPSLPLMLRQLVALARPTYRPYSLLLLPPAMATFSTLTLMAVTFLQQPHHLYSVLPTAPSWAPRTILLVSRLRETAGWWVDTLRRCTRLGCMTRGWTGLSSGIKQGFNQ